MDEEEDSNSDPKSLICEKFALVTFVPRTNRTVNIFWLDYNGRRVKYGTLTRGASLHVTTYETHPWVFHDAETGDQLVTSGGEKAYYPQAWAGEQSPVVYVDIPVYSLKERCLQVVRSLHNSDEIEKYMIPYTLKDELKESNQVPFDVYMYFEPVL